MTEDNTIEGKDEDVNAVQPETSSDKAAAEQAEAGPTHSGFGALIGAMFRTSVIVNRFPLSNATPPAPLDRL